MPYGRVTLLNKSFLFTLASCLYKHSLATAESPLMMTANPHHMTTPHRPVLTRWDEGLRVWRHCAVGKIDLRLAVVAGGNIEIWLIHVFLLQQRMLWNTWVGLSLVYPQIT